MKSKKKNFTESLPAGFLIYPVSQAADITAFKETVVPVGDDQLPMIEQTNEIVRSFNQIYKKNLLVKTSALLALKGQRRLSGIDGKAKMSKSLNNAIYLSGSSEELKRKVMSIFTEPNHIRVDVPGEVENNTVFAYLDVFCNDLRVLNDMKEHYQRGGLGDVKVKRYLNEILQSELEPIRVSREYYEKNLDYINELLLKGSYKAREIAAATLKEVRESIGINYFS